MSALSIPHGVMLQKKGLLAHLKWGHDYTATQLAQVLRTHRPTVVELLQQLVDEDQLRSIQTTARVVHYSRVSPGQLAMKGHGSLPDRVPPTSTAAPPVRRNFNASLSGYESELDTKRRLVLLARDRGR